MNVAEAVADVLKQEGVEFIVGYPVNPVIEQAARRDIRTIIVRQERTGIHMADAYSRLSSGDRFGVFVMQHGPGTENAFGGVAQAYSESVPILVMPAGYPRRIAEVDPNFSSSLNYRNVAKISEKVLVPEAIGDAMRRGIAQLRNGRPRPVVIEVPTDVFREEVPGEFKYTPSPRTRYGPAPDDVERAARVLAGAARPVIYAGQGVHYARAWPELRELAELLNAPVTTSLEGKSAFPESHPLSLGSGGRSLPEPVFRFLQDADVIFGIGCSFGTTGFGIQFPAGKTYIHATLDPADIGKDLHAEYALAGDAKLTLRALIDTLKSNPGKHAAGRADVPGKIREIRAGWMEKWRPKLESNDTPLSPYRVLNDLLHTVDPANTVITHDAGSPRDQISPFWCSTEPLSYIGWGKTTQLGYGLGLAMGAKLTHPGKLCINVWGDAAIGFTGMDLETAVRERIPILSILLNNFSMAIELPIMQAATEKYRSTDISGHYADMAKAFGAYGERVTDPAEIVPAIERGIKMTQEGQPALLEFITAKEIEYSVFR
jgi:acetolactate synthase-1/2/3 large subunit